MPKPRINTNKEDYEINWETKNAIEEIAITKNVMTITMLTNFPFIYPFNKRLSFARM